MTKFLYTLAFLLLTACILTHSRLSLSYALLGLDLWYSNMIPILLPFMILSGIMIRMHLTEQFGSFAYPVVKPLFRVSRNVCYAMVMGFLCGFPMGAKTVADLYEQKKISLREAEYLLAFCNNIGPVYFVGFVLPLLGRRLTAPYLFGMYGIPLAYGIALRYTRFRDLSAAGRLEICASSREPSRHRTKDASRDLFLQIDNSIQSALQSILSLGGYMILCNLLNLVPHILLKKPPVYLAPLLEISGGLRMLGDKNPLFSLLVLPFGGFSCIAQTYSCIRKTPLSIRNYVLHKILLTGLTALYYIIWYVSSSESFLY